MAATLMGTLSKKPQISCELPSTFADTIGMSDLKQRVKVIPKIRALRKESDFLLSQLEYYGWLEENGLSWDRIKGATGPLVLSTTIKQEIKNYARRRGVWDNDMMFTLIEENPDEHRYPKQRRKYDDPLREWLTHPPRGARGISYLLHDGSKVVLPFPPFPHKVIYNKGDEADDWKKKDITQGSL